MNNRPVESLVNRDASVLKSEVLENKRKYLAAIKGHLGRTEEIISTLMIKEQRGRRLMSMRGVFYSLA